MISGLALAGSALLAYLRAATPSNPRAIELVALSPLAFPLAGFGLICALVVVPLTRGWGRKAALAVAALTALAAAISFSWIAPLYVGKRPSGQGKASLIVMAQNLEYGAPQAITSKTLDAGVDVLIVTDAPAPSVLQLAAGEMRQALPYHVGVGEHGPNGSVVLSRYPLTEVALISDGGDSRVVTVHTPELGNVDIVALHPTPPYQEGAWAADYERITSDLRHRYAATAGTSTRPVVIAGDLNATLDHAPLRSIQALGFADAVDQLNLGFKPTWPAPGSVRRAGISVPPFVQIDHILTSPALMIATLTTFHCDGADHLGVLAEVQRARL
jgi:endonuclease/exonuclease/phosphatase (EEP) superfamily protein YafD